MRNFRKVLTLGLCIGLLLGSVAHAADGANKTKTLIESRKVSLRTAPWSKKTRQALQKIMDKFVSHPMTERFIDDQLTRDMRDNLDRFVTLKLQGLSQYEELRAQSTQVLDAMIENMTTKYLASLAEASKIQYSQYLDMIKRVSEREYFEPRIRKDAKAFVENTSEMNAYTYSIKAIRFVILQGLVERFESGAQRIVKDPLYKGKQTPEQVAQAAIEAVIGHELGHIRNEHVLNQMMLISVLRASIEQQLMEESPESLESSSDAEQVYEGMDKVFRKTLQRALRASRMTSLRKDASAADDAMLNKLYDQTRETAEALLKDAQGMKQIRKFVADKEILGAAGGDVEAQINQINAFLSEYSRSCETTADRMGQMATSREAAEYADMLLAGVTNREAAKKQSRAVNQRLAEYPEQMEALLDGDHPETLARFEQYEYNEKNDLMMKVYSTPYLTALHWYFAVSNYLEALRQAQDNDQLELPQVQFLTATIEKYKQFENALAELVTNELWSDVQDYLSNKPKRDLETLEETSKYLEYRELDKRMASKSPLNIGIAARTGSHDGLFGRLDAKLEELVQQVQAEAEAQIAKLGPNATPEQEKAIVEAAKAKVQDIAEIMSPIMKFQPESPIADVRSMYRQKVAQRRLECQQIVLAGGQK